MQKVRVPINSFQYGEVSDSLVMRTDTAIYAASAQRVENLLVMAEGSVKKRTGLRHAYTYGLTYSASDPVKSCLASFIYDDNEQYIVSIEHQKLRFFRIVDADTITLVDTVTADTSSAALPFDQDYIKQYTTAQYGDVMFICHPLFAPRVITRTSLTNFDVSTFTFDSRPDDEVIFQPYYPFQAQGVTLNPSATNGNGITLVTSAAYWDTTGDVFPTGNYENSKHVGVTVKYHDTEIEIVSVQSATSATGNVVGTTQVRLAVVNPLRTISGTTTVEVTHLGHGFAGGETIVISEADATGGINVANINGSRVIATIIDENTYTYPAGGSASSSADGGGNVKVTTHAPTAGWSEQAFSAKRGYPAAVVFHENRLVFGGTIAQPDTIWMSKIGSFFNFDVGKAEDIDAISLTAATGEVNEIRYLVSNRDLQVFTASNELYIPTYLNQAITPANAQIRKQTPFGAEFVKPASIDGATIFVQYGGNSIREYLYTDTEDAYTSTSVSTLSAHLIDSPQSMAVVHGGFGLSDSIAFVTRTNGEAAMFSSNRAEKRASWSRVTTNGRFAGAIAAHNRMFVNVYDEYNKLQLCEFTGDIGLDMYIYEAIPSNNLVDVSDLYANTQVVDVLATDGTTVSHIGSFTTNSAAKIDISAHAGNGYTHVYVGKKFTAKLITNAIDVNAGNGAVSGDVRGISSVVLDVKNTRSIKVNGSNFSSLAGFNGKKEIRVLGYSRDPQVTIEQNDPLPFQVNGLIAELII